MSKVDLEEAANGIYYRKQGKLAWDKKKDSYFLRYKFEGTYTKQYKSTHAGHSQFPNQIHLSSKIHSSLIIISHSSLTTKFKFPFQKSVSLTSSF